MQSTDSSPRRLLYSPNRVIRTHSLPETKRRLMNELFHRPPEWSGMIPGAVA